LLPSKAHLTKNPNSDHNTGYAVDLTHNIEVGIDCAEVFKHLQNDPRVKYLIFNHRIWTPEKGVDIYLGHLIREIEFENEQKIKQEEEKKEEAKGQIGDPSKVFANPGNVKYSDLKAYLEKARGERLKV
jgi:hypothetical protein